MSKKTTYSFDEKLQHTVEGLRMDLNLETNSAVLRKAIALLQASEKVVKEGGQLYIIDKDGVQSKVIFN